MRIGDATVFGADGHRFHEIKTNPDRRVSAQLRRIQAATSALWEGTGLPGGNPRKRLFGVNVPLTKHLGAVAEAAAAVVGTRPVPHRTDRPRRAWAADIRYLVWARPSLLDPGDAQLSGTCVGLA
jgi:hypothetical protein